MTRFLFAGLLAGLVTFNALAVEMPSSVIHAIHVKFKADASKATVDAAVASIGEMAKKFPAAGIQRVWLKPVTVQGGETGFTHVLAMEFKDAAALKAYSGSDAQKWWYEKWLPIREVSNTSDVSNAAGKAAKAGAMFPKSVMHIINVKFKKDAAKADVDAAVAGIGEMAKKYPGITNVWLTPVLVQGGKSGFTHVLAMEFKDEAALKAYSGSDAQKAWYEKWLKVRELSNTHDVTN
jgi:quinol monooxygenase YgiN